VKTQVKLFLIASLLLCSKAYATVDQVVVTNCAGDVVAAQVSELGAPNNIVATFAESAAGSVTLKCDGAQDRSSEISAGRVTFRDVPTSSCRLCPAGEGAGIEKVAISRADAGSSWSGGKLAGLAGLGGAAAIAGLAIDGGGSGESAGVTALVAANPSASSVVAEAPAAARAPAVSGGVSISGQHAAATNCLNGQNPDALSPFF
jgi:hypothetical protein